LGMIIYPYDEFTEQTSQPVKGWFF
jgi:hypothetical protein